MTWHDGEKNSILKKLVSRFLKNCKTGVISTGPKKPVVPVYQFEPVFRVGHEPYAITFYFIIFYFRLSSVSSDCVCVCDWLIAYTGARESFSSVS